MMKKTLSLLLALLMVLSLLPTAAFADTNDFSAKFSVVGVKAANGDEKTEDNIGAGDTVTVAFVIEKNPGTGAFQFQLSFDKSKLLLKKLVAAGDISGYSVLGNTKVDSEKYGMFSGDADEDTTETGALANLTFEVLDTVAGGEILTIDVEDASMKVGTVDGDPVPATITPCTITVAGGGETPTVVPVAGVTLSGKGLTSEEGKYALLINEGDTATLTATVDPENATDKTVTWSADEGITVNNGVITTQIGTLGKFTVTAKAGEQTAVCEVTVQHGKLTYKPGEAASCTKEGHQAYWFCDTCKHYYTDVNGAPGEETAADKVIIPKLPHTLKLVAEKAATCTTGGNVAYWKCSVCGAMFEDATGSMPTNEESVKTPANGHSYSSEWSKDANNHWHECTVCQEKEPGTENPHDWKVVVKKDYAEGSKQHEVQCSECGAFKNEDHERDDITTAWERDKDNHWHVYGCGTIMNKSAHDWDGGVVTRQPTCTREGEKTYTCGTCGETKTEAVAKAPHTLQKTDAKAATCTEDGNAEYYTCQTCGKFFSDAAGDKEITKADWFKEKLGHKYTDESLRVTWGGDGKSAHIRLTCDNGCGKPWEEDVTLNNGITAAVKTPATCTEVGTTTYTAKVTNPTTGKDLTAAKDVQDIPALGHDMTQVAAKAATCTEDGNNEYYVCKRCKGVFKDALGNDSTTVEAETIKAPGTHDFGDAWFDSGDGHYRKCRRTGCDAKSDPELHTSWSKPHESLVWAPDHKSATATYPACEVCGVKPTKEAIVTIEVTAEPTCTTIGKRTYTATQKMPDNSTRSTFYYEDIPALGHDYTDDSLKALWTPDGKIVTVTFTCSRNGKYLHTLKLELEKNDVTAAVKIPATCTEMGTTTYTAKVTNPTTQHEFTLTKDVQDIALLPHTMVKTEDKAATCVAAGNNAYWTCSVCKGVFKDELGKTATTVEAETLPIDPANHTGNTELRDAVTATCNMSGHEADTYCKDCGVLLSRGATIPATGKHTYGEDGRCTSCGNVNPTAGVNTDDIKAADTVNGKPVSPDNSGKVIASDDGKTVIKTPAAADDNTVQQVKDALTGGSVTLYVDNRKTEALTGSDGGVAALEALAASASGERKQELEKLAEALKALLSDSGRKNAAGQMVYDGEMQLCDANGVPVAELVQSPNSIQVTLPITEAQYQAMQGKKVCVLRSSTDASGAAAVTELSATVGGSQGARVLSFSTDKGGALALTVYETVSSGSSGGSSGGSGSSTAPRTADAGVTVWCALLGISALLGTALVAKKRRQA